MRKVFGLLTVLLFLTLPAQADPVTFELAVEFSGGTAPSGAAPWLTIEFADVGANQVQMSLTGNLQGATEFFTGVYVNFTGDVSKLSFLFQPGSSTGPQAVSITNSLDCCKADGDGYFDIGFSFPDPDGPGGDRFNGTETVVYLIEGTLGQFITAGMFDDRSLGAGNSLTGLLAAAKVQGIGPDDESGWITPVPEPGSLLLLGSGLLTGVIFLRRRSV